MNTGIWIAIITAITSIIVSFIGIYINTRNSNKLEKLKFDLDQKREKAKIMQEFLKSRTEAIGKHIKYIQVIKDYIMLIIECPPKSLDTDTVKIDMKDAVENYIKCYEHESNNFTKEEDTPAHKVKNILFNFDIFLTEIITKDEFIELSHGQRLRLSEIKNELNEMQNILRDFKFKLISENN